MTDPFDRPGTARPLIPQIAAMSDHAKLITYLEQENSVLHSKLRQLEIKLEKAEKALAVEKARGQVFGRWTYPHMCRNEHEQIGHSDSEHERCPLCRANDEIYDLKEALAQIIRGRGEK